ncbi:MAG TPA: TIM barrel protein, partial [Planctomycetota bacterium]|nr:TIM barrel protein [Planctomycetota bacterium]
MHLSAFTDILEGGFEPALDALAGIGLQYVDLRSGLDGFTVDTLQGADIDKRLKAIAARGLKVGCVASWGVNAMKGDYDPGDAAHRKSMRERTLHLAKLAHAAGAANVRVYSFKRPAGRVVSDTDRADNAGFLIELAGICAEFGRVLVIENEPPTLTSTCAELGDLMKRVGFKASNLRVNWDIVNGWRAGELPWAGGVFDPIAGYVAHVHVKGAKGASNASGSTYSTMAVPGTDD